MRMFSTKLFTASTVLLAGFALSASAHADTVYTSSSAFAAATTGYTTVDFGNDTFGSTGYATANSSYSGVGITASNGSTVHINSAAYYATPGEGGSHPAYPDGNYFIVFGGSPNDAVTISLPTPSTAFSIALGGAFTNASTEDFSITLSDGQTFTFNTSDYATSGDSLGFFGVTTDTNITSATITITSPAGDYGTFDTVQYGSAIAPTPEPSSLLMFGTGVLGIAGTVRRRFIKA